MSEDAYPAFHSSEHKAHDGHLIVADSAAMAALLASSGWPSALITLGGAANAATGHIRAFDWRDMVDAAALNGIASDCAILCLVSIETIDQADALLVGRLARFVFGQAPALIAAELADIRALLAACRAHDPSDEERARLQALAMELARLADQLGQISAGGDADDGDALADRSIAYQAEKTGDIGAVTPPDPRRIRNLIQLRRLRDRFFDAGLFADPAWDMLLDLAASRLEGRSVSVSSLCIAAAVPPTTALRWIRMMTDQNLLVRRADAADARRMFVDLADHAFDQLCGWFALVEERGGMGA